MKAKRLRVKLRRVRRAASDLWADSIDPLDRAVARVILTADLDAASQTRLLRAWLALR